MTPGWMSPNFGPTGCVGAVVWWLVMVVAVGALLYMVSMGPSVDMNDG